MPKRVIIVGCGISGAAAAQEFTNAGYEVVVLEQEERLGGKIYTVDELNSELGAVIFFCNYPVTDTVFQKKMSVENVLPGEEKSINIILYGNEHPTLAERIQFAVRFMYELMQYSRVIGSFDHANDTRTFAKYLSDHHFINLAKYFEFWLPGMGYGPLDVISASHALNYTVLQPLNVFAMTSRVFGQPIKHVHGGYQRVVEKMVEGFDVRTSVDIKNIERSNEGVRLAFDRPNCKTETIEGDLLVLTMSPYFWDKLPMELTPLEKQCISNLDCVPYSVAICDIEGFPPNQVFIADALKKEGLGHIGFIHTNNDSVNPKARRSVVYFNLSKNDRSFSLSEGSQGRDVLREDLRKLGYPNIEILATKDWQDYNPTLPYEIRMKLENSQGKNGTLYLGTYNSFETVADAEKYSRMKSREYLGLSNPKSYLSSARRFTHFFRDLRLAPQQVNKPAVDPLVRPKL